ncbi:MAG: response regulator [Methylococcaceae bacterium]
MLDEKIIPANECERIAALKRYEILDTPPDGSFDRITALVAQLLDVPIVIASLVDTDRIWFKSHHGLAVSQIDREPGLCASAILTNDAYLITDAAVDPRTLANPLVAGDFGLRFYAAVPLQTHDNFNLGTLCCLDFKPRTLGKQQLQILEAMAQVIMDQMELRRAARHVDELHQKLLDSHESLRIVNTEQEIIFNTATSGIVFIKDDVILRCNRKLEEIMAYAPGELLGKSPRLWFPDDGTDIECLHPDNLIHQLVRKDGSLFWARLSEQAIDSLDTNQGVVMVVDDISSEHEASEALRAAKEIAEDTTRIKSEFLSNMSHEIRTPMNGVLGMLDLLSETELNSIQQDWVKIAHSSAEALLKIINDILDLSRLEADRLEMERVKFNLVTLVDDICALMAGRAHAKSLELNCLLSVDIKPYWLGDPLRIRQVLTNLISNSIKFTASGEVTVNVSYLARENSQSQLRFEIRDTGVGISSEQQLRLFQSFSQADSSTARHHGGSGLGLFISKKLVNLMGGAIGIDSEPGKGTCLWVTLPLEQSSGLANEEPSYNLSGKRALIVDDNATNRNILMNYLSRWSLEVHEANNGTAALLELQALTQQGMVYDLIVMDMDMPIMDGLTLAKCLSQIPVLAKIPIILLSSSSDHFDPADYQNTGIVQRLLKPARQSQLLDAIVNAIQGVSPIDYRAAVKVQLPSYQNKRILVVEDDRINQELIIATLSRFDIVPEIAENGERALAMLEQKAYDLILMDCQMPVIDGYATTLELRLLEARKNLPHQIVIALTANVLEGSREKCLAAGMDDYLSKPLVFEQLKDMLALYFSKSSNERALILADKNSSLPVWDKAAALKHLENDSDLLFEMIDLLLVESPKHFQSLLLFQAEGNLPELAKTAHLIKGMLDHFYAITARDCAYLLEQTALNGQPADYQSMIQTLINAVNELITQLRLTRTS